MPLLPLSVLKPMLDDTRLARCGRCGLYRDCRSSKMPVSGEGKLGVLVVAEAPGREEDKQNTQLVGPAGQLLRRYLRELDVDLDRDCWKTNAVICFPGGTPTDEDVRSCRPNLLKTIRELKPRMILVLGRLAVSSLIGWLWRENPGEMGRWVGWRIPSQRMNAWVCPTYHPSYVMRVENKDSKTRSGRAEARVVSIMFREHLRRAFGLKGRPWKKKPDYGKQVKMLMSGGEVAKAVEAMLCSESGVPVAFDYESNMLKPDSGRAEIVSCSMSNGEETIAYMMTSETRGAVVRFLRSSVPKIAHNMKHEDRWSRAVLKTPVRRWHWCTMQTAHVLDNRRGISGLKFQAFVRLGQGVYDEQMSTYLDGGPNTPNKIRRADVRDLLLYNGLDSLLTWHLYSKQVEDLKRLEG